MLGLDDAGLGPASIDALRHVEEATGLSLVEAPPLTVDVPIGYHARLCEKLTSRQLDTALRAAQALMHQGVFFLGDGPGTGKTRILAAVALYYQLTQPLVQRLWLVPNAMLCKQALRELELLSTSAEVCSYAQLRRRGSSDAAGCLLILDEAHALRHPSAQTRVVESMQSLALAVIYSTATPASDVRRLGYMTRLHLWGCGTPFESFEAFSSSLLRWGLGAAELLALELKRRGLYCCHRLPEVEVNQLELVASSEIQTIFDACTASWATAERSACSMLFFKRLLTSLKVRSLALRWRQDLDAGRSIVIVLQGTGAAAQSSDDGTMLLRCLRRAGRFWHGEMRLPEDALLEVRRVLGDEEVGEISGRAVSLRGGSSGNAAALGAFQRGELRVLIISAAGSVGFNVTSPHPIRMYLVELPTIPETLAQQLGRCNRLNMLHKPEYFHVSLRTIAERRVESILARRSATLGALCCADQQQLLLRHRPWSTPQIRWVGLELVTRSLAKRAAMWRPPEELLERSARQEDQAIDTLDLSQLFFQEFPEEGLRHIVSRCPSALAWVLPAVWTPGAHLRFPLSMRQAARTAALSLFRISGLDAILMTHIMSYAMGDDWDVQPIIEALDATRLDVITPSAFMDAAAQTPLATQQALIRSCEAAALRFPVPALALKTLESHARRYVEHGKRYDVIVEVLDENSTYCTMKTHLSLRATSTPSSTLCLYKLPSGRLANLVTTSTGVELRLPGKDRGISGRSFLDVATAQRTLKLQTSLTLDALQVYRMREMLELQRQQVLGQAASHILRVAVAEPFDHWEASMRQVLAFELRGRRIAGLLMSDRASPP